MEGLSGPLALVLAPGGAAFVWVVFKGVQLWRNGSQASEAQLIKNLQRWGQAESARAERAIELYDYWRGRAGELEYIIRTEIGPEKLPPRRQLPPGPERTH